MFFKRKITEVKNQQNNIESDIPQSEPNEIKNKSQIYSEYKEKTDKAFMEIKDNKEIIAILENFLPQVPQSIFSNKDFYTYFEYLVLSLGGDIGSLVLWSSDSDLSDINVLVDKENLKIMYFWQLRDKEITINQQNLFDRLNHNLPFNTSEINSFINDKFKKMTKLLKGIVLYDEESDYIFVLLRLIQLSIGSITKELSLQNSGIDSSEIEKLTFEECMVVSNF
jgi:hypothetical protein